MIPSLRFVVTNSPVDVLAGWATWCMTEVWLGPARLISVDSLDERQGKVEIESSFIFDAWNHGTLDDWFALGFLCNCGKCAKCKPVSDLRILVVE